MGANDDYRAIPDEVRDLPADMRLADLPERADDEVTWEPSPRWMAWLFWWGLCGAVAGLLLVIAVTWAQR